MYASISVKFDNIATLLTSLFFVTGNILVVNNGCVRRDLKFKSVLIEDMDGTIVIASDKDVRKLKR